MPLVILTAWSFFVLLATLETRLAIGIGAQQNEIHVHRLLHGNGLKDITEVLQLRAFSPNPQAQVQHMPTITLVFYSQEGPYLLNTKNWRPFWLRFEI